MRTPFLVSLLAALCSSQSDDWTLQDWARTRYQCWQGGRYVPEGTVIERGRFWYECVQGRQEPRGCLDNYGRRLRLDENEVDNEGFQRKCQLDNQGYLSFPVTACVVNGQIYQPGQTWRDYAQTTWYQCNQVTDWHLRVDTMGCVYRGQELRVGDALDEGSSWMGCIMLQDSSVAMVCKGCIQEGRRLNIGDSWIDGEFVYYCKVENNRCGRTCIGCQAPGGHRLFNGDRYFRDETIYQCDIRRDEQAHRLVGCVQKDQYGYTIERVIGCHWYEERGDQMWEMKCTEEGGLAKKSTVGCIYRENGVERLMIPPASHTIWYSEMYQKNMVVTCAETYQGSGEYRSDTFPAEDIRYDRRKIAGLSFEAPRGK